ncbi:MAG: TIGR02449 family protein [Thiomargarita sp.]|nr:TIGR02449 family protein [Thiomargarita sp.]
MEHADLQSLETKIDTLIKICKQLADENKSLIESKNNLGVEHAALLDKNTQARTRIEAMITRLKSMEITI